MFGRKLRSPEAKRKRRIYVTLVGSAAFATFLLFVAGIVWLLHQPQTRVTEMTVYGADAVSAAEIETTVAEKLSGKRLSFIPRDNYFFLSTTDLEASLLEAFPRIANVSVKTQGLRHLAISIDERTPLALWCGDIIPRLAKTTMMSAPQGGVCYYLDTEGYIFAKAPTFTGNPLFRYYGSLAHGDVIGQQFIDVGEFQALQQLLRDIEAFGLRVSGVLLLDEETIEVYVNQGVRLLLARTVDYSEVIDTLASLTEAGELERDDLERIDYIDMRFGSRIYVKDIPLLSESTPESGVE